MTKESPVAITFASSQMPLLLTLPIPLAATMMQQVARADRLFPVERRELDRMLQSLHTPRPKEVQAAVQAFASLKLSHDLLRSDWQREPADFVDKMTAELWASNQIETFRAAAKELVPAPEESVAQESNHEPRCIVVVLDKSLQDGSKPKKLFSKLRPYGTFFTSAADEKGAQTIREWLDARAQGAPDPYAHWSISGTPTGAETSSSYVSLSFHQLRRTRAKILTLFDRERKTFSARADGLREALLHVTPDEIGLASMQDPILQDFTLDLFTGGSGTQLYATTFVQWTVREALRRAQPQTVVAQCGPRSTATSMDERLAHPEMDPPLDPAGSLVDAEMGAYMSFLNSQRLPNSRNARFLAWHEGFGQALLAGPQLPAGTSSDSPIQMQQLLALLSPHKSTKR